MKGLYMFVPACRCYKEELRGPLYTYLALRAGTRTRLVYVPAIGLESWLPALWLLTNRKNGISSYELRRAFGVTQKQRVVHAVAPAPRLPV